MGLSEQELRKIRERRRVLGISQRDMADRIGTTEKQYRKWEKGEEEIPPSIYDEICLTLGF